MGRGEGRANILEQGSRFAVLGMGSRAVSCHAHRLQNHLDSYCRRGAGSLSLHQIKDGRPSAAHAMSNQICSAKGNAEQKRGDGNMGRTRADVHS